MKITCPKCGGTHDRPVPEKWLTTYPYLKDRCFACIMDWQQRCWERMDNEGWENKLKIAEEEA